jgi:outer membrane lipoprotein SlyB
MKKDDEIIESLIAGGLIGAALGALITGNNNGSGLGAIAGAVVIASLKANENAQKTNIPLLIEEDNILYEVKADGSKKIIKSISRNLKKVPKRFILQ